MSTIVQDELYDWAFELDELFRPVYEDVFAAELVQEAVTEGVDEAMETISSH